MIPRYTRPQMGRLWEPENRYRKWLQVELAVVAAMAELQQIPAEAAETILRKADFSVERIEAIEEEVRHDVIAFLTCVTEHVGENGRYLHLGLTSSDVLDTSLALLLVEAADILLQDVDDLLVTLKQLAFEHKDTVMIGRSHGVHAEPITFGLKLALWYAEFVRNRSRLVQARETVRVGKISGAVGTYANVDPRVEQIACTRLGLQPAPISTQIIQRDRHAEYFSVLAIIAASLEKIATEIRHLQRTEVLEVEEPFGKAQKGSSAMPHKRNPIVAENICGLARVVRTQAIAALENVALWHERDISHSSVERIIAPDSTILLDTMLHRTTAILRGMTVHRERMKQNLERTAGLFNSQRIMLSLTQKGWSREQAYRAVQRHAMAAWSEGGNFRKLLEADPAIAQSLSRDELDNLFDIHYYLRYVDDIFARVFVEEAAAANGRKKTTSEADS
ncbi:MAG: adenylosuccinate lyase [Deltaproteobacteria bacterium]|nr:adenylosuccinate lyase [Deltaproteobacteria bacterium]